MQINNPKHLCLDEVDGDVFDIVLFFNSKAKYLSYTFVFVRNEKRNIGKLI
jgi:hypothetical protein